jgi:Ni,Fe-hydrogenase I cytochrome b subunit
MGHGDLIVSLRVGPLIHVGWLFALQDELISHHISYLSSPVDVLEAILLLNGWLRLLYQVLGLITTSLLLVMSHQLESRCLRIKTAKLLLKSWWLGEWHQR